jgi:hypothetical protein
MTKIYKNNITNSLFKDIVTPEEVFISNDDINPVTFYVNVQPDYFEIKCSYLGEDPIEFNSDSSVKPKTYSSKIYFWHKINLTDLMSKNSMCDNSLWHINYNDLYSHHSIEDSTPSVMVLNPLQIQDQFALTYINKGNSFGKTFTDGILYQIFVPYTEGSNMTDFSYRINIDATQYGVNHKTIPIVFDPASPAINSIQETTVKPIDLISPITLTGPDTVSANSSIEISVQTTPGISYVYLEQVHGILPLVKVPITNGTGTFKVLTNGMSTGDELQVKAGFRKWNHVTAYTKTIS